MAIMTRSHICREIEDGETWEIDGWQIRTCTVQFHKPWHNIPSVPVAVVTARGTIDDESQFVEFTNSLADFATTTGVRFLGVDFNHWDSEFGMP